jgi:hypothetical protein
VEPEPAFAITQINTAITATTFETAAAPSTKPVPIHHVVIKRIHPGRLVMAEEKGNHCEEKGGEKHIVPETKKFINGEMKLAGTTQEKAEEAA